jgi:alpha-mannosidase
MSGKFGATLLTDCKNGSDKPNDHTLRLTLIRTPGTAGGYGDQGTQDIGHHEFIYGIAGHADGWRDAQTDWQAERLNAPLLAFESPKHAGALGKDFSLVRISNPRIRIMALKKAEASDETILRLVELDGKPEPDVRVSFAVPISAAREVNGQEQPLGSATVTAGSLVTSFGAYQPRTFALKLDPPATRVVQVRSTPVDLTYDLATATNAGERSTSGFDGSGKALPAEMLPAQIAFHDVTFRLAAANSGSPNAIVAKGQSISLPEGNYNRLYLLAASKDGDQKAVFKAGSNSAELDIQDWSGFVGQWDDRVWSSRDTANDNYGQMTGLKPGFIKRADLAWYSDHHHDPSGTNVAYSYSYLFGYAIDLPAGAKTLQLPDNSNIRILAISVADENPVVKPAQPLYDVLPSPHAGAPDFMISAAASVSIPQGRSATTTIFTIPRGNFSGGVTLEATGLPAGVTAAFDPVITTSGSKMTLTAASSAAPASATVTISAVAAGLSHSITQTITTTPVLKNTVPANLSSAFNVNGIVADGKKFAEADSLDGGGYSLSAQTLGREQVGDDVIFRLGPQNAANAVTSRSVDLPTGTYSSVKILAVAVDGNQTAQTFAVNYADGTSSTFNQSLHDWSESRNFTGESIAAELPYRVAADGSEDNRPFYARAYSFTLDTGKQVRSISLPQNRNVVILAVTLVPATQ